MATEALYLDKDAFARMVTEEGLKTTRAGGYIYAGKKGKRGWEMYRTFDRYDAVPVSIASTANPAAGANHVSVTVPANRRWLLIGAYYSLTTDANVANRYPYIIVRGDGTSGSSLQVSSVAITASLTTLVGYGKSSGGVAGAAVSVDLGDGIELSAGAQFQSAIANIQAGDDATALYYAYKEVVL